MKRNDIVLIGDDNQFLFYGRIVKVLPNDYFLTIDCGKYCFIIHKDSLKLDNNYKGFTDKYTKRFIRMPTLRKLKQMASQYNKKVWKKNRKNIEDNGYYPHKNFLTPVTEEICHDQRS